MAQREREFAGTDRMSEHEALMWNVEKDPWLNSSGASLTILSKPASMEYLRRTMRAAAARMPRLRERVVPGFGRLSTPAWAPDPEFDLNYHLREIEMPGKGTDRELFDLATQLYNEPLDPGPDEVDLEGIIADAIKSSAVKESGGDTFDSSMADAVRDSVAHLARRQLGIARRVAGEVVLWPADPERINKSLATVGEAAAAAMNQLAPEPESGVHGSPLWKDRSRHRYLAEVTVSLADLKAAAKTVGGSVNDAFMTGLAEGAYRYHAEREAPAETFNSSFVLSTRTDAKAGGNACGSGRSAADRRTWQPFGHREPLAHVGRDPRRQGTRSAYRLCDLKLAGSAVRTLLCRRSGGAHGRAWTRRGDGSQHHGHVISR